MLMSAYVARTGTTFTCRSVDDSVLELLTAVRGHRIASRSLKLLSSRCPAEHPQRTGTTPVGGLPWTAPERRDCCLPANRTPVVPCGVPAWAGFCRKRSSRRVFPGSNSLRNAHGSFTIVRSIHVRTTRPYPRVSVTVPPSSVDCPGSTTAEHPNGSIQFEEYHHRTACHRQPFSSTTG